MSRAAPLLKAREPWEVFETDNYRVTHYVRNWSTVLVVMVSAGNKTERGDWFEELRFSVQRLNCSMIFVIDKWVRWYNYPDTSDMFHALSGMVAPYEHVAVIGGSMGGAGALLAAHYVSRISRALSFAPQFSLMRPFINFDLQFDGAIATIESHLHSDFAFVDIRHKSVVMFGTQLWQDYLHSAMFSARGFDVLYVDGAPHNVMLYLDRDSRFLNLLKLFTNFDLPFAASSVANLLSGDIASTGLRC